ncbi:microtubule integrity protein mal3 [Sorochytrium milnesiophthora]
MSESRQDILAWVNNLLSLNLTKVEELGKGFAWCQVMDSIYLDAPLKRVKFSCNQEALFLKHKIPNAIPVERLVKLKFQDNIEFAQLMKKHWDAHFPGHTYDAVGRRGGAEPAAPRDVGVKKAKSLSGSSGGLYTATATAAAPPPQASERRTQAAAPINQEMERQLNVALEQLTTLEKERDFYYNKLRAVEIDLQRAIDENRPVKPQQVLDVLYSTEDVAEDQAVAAAEM